MSGDNNFEQSTLNDKSVASEAFSVYRTDGPIDTIPTPSRQMADTSLFSSAHDDSAHATNDDDDASWSAEEEEDNNGELQRQDDDDCSASNDVIIIAQPDQEFEGLEDGTKAAPEVTVPEFSIPSQELINKIVQQVEYYFSDENIVKDDYLMKHIKRNKQGFVSLKVISSFHKMKRLTKDHRVVAFALEHSSKKLQVSENKNKVKRIDPLPRTSDKMSAEDCSKSVIATPVLSTSVEELKRSFEKCGKVLRVSVFTDDNFPPWLKTILNKNRTYHLPFAIVEYDNIESASMASKVLTNTSDWRRGMKVDVLMKPAKNKPENKEKENKQNLGDPMKPQKKKKKSKKKDQQAAAHRIAELQTTISSSGSDLDKTTTGTQDQPDRGGIPIPTSPRQNINYSKSFGCSPTKSGAHQHSQPQQLIPATRHGGLAKSPLTYELEDGTRLRSSSFGPLSSSPGRWLQKKLQAGGSGGGSASASITTVVTAGLTGSSEHNLSAAATTNTVTKEEQKTEFSHKKFTEGLIRMPRGPDGTRGFRLKRTIVQ